MLEINTDLVVYYMAVISVVAVALTIADKHRAKTHRHRISERVLMICGALGGAPAMFISMIVYRHKTRRMKFMIGLPVITLLEVGLFYYLWTFSNLVTFIQ